MTSSHHVLQGSSSVWLQWKFAFHTSQGAALIQRRAHKTPVAVHLHQFEYLTPKRDQTLSAKVTNVFHSAKEETVLHLSLSLVEHVGRRPLQVLLLRLGRVVNVDRVGGAVRQVAAVDGARSCLELKTTASSDGPPFRKSKP